jgi:excinuclease ABC subunit C
MPGTGTEKLNNIISGLPENPGVYQFINLSGKIIYVGKAKNLKKRISSYFKKNHENYKTDILVRKISDIRYIVVDSEQDALLLENSFIKKLQPKYNVLLKDDKSFPWICIKNERFPRVFLTRTLIKDGSQYFGPYTSARMVRVILDLIRQLYHLRSCSFILSEENISKQKIKVCLEYHIGNCKAPCIGNHSVEEYNLSIEQIKNILRGNINTVTRYLKKLMAELSGEYNFEEAGIVKEKIILLEKFQSRSAVVNPSINKVDVFSIVDDSKHAFVNFMKVMNGSIIQAYTIELVKKLDETKEELLPLGITEIKQLIKSEAKEMILPFLVEYDLGKVKITVPKQGDKKRLLELSERNAKQYQKEKLILEEGNTARDRSIRLLETVKSEIHLTETPVLIECFDNSNLQGSNPVAACVVFRHGKPSKKEYRHYNVKTVNGINDFASIEEIVFRRYLRMTDEKSTLPQLIIIDGGKGQLNAALNALEKLNLRGKIPVIGIAKKLEEIYFADDPVPLYIDKKSETLKFLQLIRNEAHRFGISFHRTKRSNAFLKSELVNIKGIGERNIEKLFSEFKSIEKIKNKSLEELSEIIGNSKAGLIKDYFNKKLI